jgi:hypothetical protein
MKEIIICISNIKSRCLQHFTCFKIRFTFLQQNRPVLKKILLESGSNIKTCEKMQIPWFIFDMYRIFSPYETLQSRDCPRSWRSVG